jgi:Zn-finger nucleic acid-binding protein
MEDIACVSCSAPLEPVNIGGEHVQACPDTHGIWLERDQLMAITGDDGDDAVAAASSDDSGRSCPVCQDAMGTWTYGSGVVVDQCEEHGVWVDDEEISRIEAWTEAWSALAS